MVWRLRHIRTEHNPADSDKPSRIFDPKPGPSTRTTFAKAPPLCGHVKPSSFEQHGSGGAFSGTSPSGSGLKGIAAWELCCGTASLTRALRRGGVSCFKPVDVLRHEYHDLTHPPIQHVIFDAIGAGLLWYVHLGTPCTIWSRTRHNIKDVKKARAKERVGVQLATFSVRVAWRCLDAGVGFTIENPRSSLIWSFGPCNSFCETAGCSSSSLTHSCMVLEVRNPRPSSRTSLNLFAAPAMDIPLRGSWRVKRGDQWVSENKTLTAGGYSPSLCRHWAAALASIAPDSSRRCD